MKKFKLGNKYLYSGITAFVVIICSISFFMLLNKMPSVRSFISLILSALSPIIAGIFIAYLLNKIVNFFEKRFFLKTGDRMFPKNERKAKSFARILSITVSMLLMLVILGGILALALPQVYLSIEKLVDKSSYYVASVKDWVEKFLVNNPNLQEAAGNLVGNITEYITNWVKSSVLPRTQDVIANIYGGVISVVHVIVNLIIGLVISVYILYSKEKFSAQFKKILYSIMKPESANKVLRFNQFLDRTFGGFIVGKLLNALVFGIVCYIVLEIIDMPYAPLVSVLIGFSDIVPFFGPIVGTVLSALLIILENPLKGLIFIIIAVILEQINGNIVEPKILGGTTGISGFWIMFSILFFGGLFGFWGLILGVPTFAVIYSAVSNFSRARLAEKDLSVSTSDYYNLAFIDPTDNRMVYNTPEAHEPSRIQAGEQPENKNHNENESSNQNSNENDEGTGQK